MSNAAAPPLVETGWLQDHLLSPDVVVLDCSWHLPDSGLDGHDDYLRGHIPGALFFDIEQVRDKASPYALMLPSSEHFAAAASALGIGNDTHVVVYDRRNVSARVRWMFRYFGHDKVSVLHGGWMKWAAEGRPEESGEGPNPAPARFSARERHDMVAGWKDVLAAIEDRSAQIIDARTAERFTGERAPSYAGIVSGHMPGALNLPYTDILRPEDHLYVDAVTAAETLRTAGIDLERPIISTCGSGVSAAVIGLALEMAGARSWKLYDGSWNEWSQRPDLPKER